MRRRHHAVTVAGTGSFLPNAPVPNERVDEVLGPLDGAPLRVQTFIRNMGPRILSSGGIETRHFAIDPETHRLTHTVASLGEAAARRALEAAGMEPDEVELLVLSSPSYDQTTPPTTTILQERLGIEQCAEMEIHSNCSGVGKAMQVAADALTLGHYRTALITYVQISSVYLRSCYFTQERMNKTQAALRYILADGAGAVVLRTAESDNGVPRRVLGTFVESVGGRLPAAMTAGGGVADLQEWGGLAEAIVARGSHHLDQDFAAVSRDAGPRLLDGVVRLAERLELAPTEIDHLVFSIPTMQLYESNLPRFRATFGPGDERMKFRARHTGYCGGASILLHFDEIVRNGELKPGQLAVAHSVESSKWMTAGFAVRW
jgi:3-oxoacyl-[acyl-carrier-protein] synthase-3